MIDVSGGKNSIKNSVAIMSAGDVFVINLYAAMTPMPSVPKSLKGFEEHRLYQVARVEDGRHRYRLRLGFFNSEADAELAVAGLRSMYPAAFVSRAGAEDMRYTGDPLLTGRFTARATTPTAPAAEIKPAVTTSVAERNKPVSSPAATRPETRPATATVAAPPAVAVKTISKPVAPPPAPPTIELTAHSLLDMDEPFKKNERSTPFTMTTHQPFHVARGIDLPDTDLELAPTVIPGLTKRKDPETTVPKPVAQAPLQARSGNDKLKTTMPPAQRGMQGQPSKPSPPPQVSKSMAALATKKAPAAPPAAAKSAAPSVPAAKTVAPAAPVASKPTAPKNSDDYVPILDTTMTIRTLSLAEMEDENQPKWFSVQLAMSEQAFNLDAMPRLDIFAAYRLYSVAVKEEGSKLKHSLRLGFFKEEVSAEAVSGYLTTFFPSPTITRIGIAEFERFSESKELPTAELEPKVVNLKDKRETVAPAKPTFGVNPAPLPTRPKTPPATSAAEKHESTQPGMRRGPSGKYSVDAMSKKHANSTSDSGIRKNSQRPQSFLSKLIGRELD